MMRREGGCRRLELQCHGSAAVKESQAVGPSHRGWIDYLLMTFRTSDIYSASTISFDGIRAMMWEILSCFAPFVGNAHQLLRYRFCCLLFQIWCIASKRHSLRSLTEITFLELELGKARTQRN
jgi:hypothetical protein